MRYWRGIRQPRQLATRLDLSPTDPQLNEAGPVFTVTLFGPGGALGSPEVMSAGVGSPEFFGIDTADDAEFVPAALVVDTDSVTRGQMSVFLGKTFDLILYGP